MTRVSINPGQVAWCGERASIQLQSPDDRDVSALALVFRIVLSPFGRGSAGLVLGAPDRRSGWPDAPNLLMTDNQRLMRWIVDGWVRKMPAFRDRPGLDHMSWLDLDSAVRRSGDDRTRHGERLRASGVTAAMSWQRLGAPLPVELTTENSVTGEHEMYAVLCEAKAAHIEINDSRLPGVVSSRPFLGRTLSTAWLSYSETWVAPPAPAD